MVYVDPKNLGYHPYMNKWIRSKSESDQETLTAMFEKYVDGAITYIIDGLFGLQQLKPLKMIIPQTGLNMVSINVRALISSTVLTRIIKEKLRNLT